MSYWGRDVRLEVVAANPIDTDASTIQTIQRMIPIARYSAGTAVIGNAVNDCLASLPRQHSMKDLARAIWWWVKKHVTYVEDETILATKMGYEDPNQELLISPEVLLHMPTPMGDCDDFSMVVASLLVCAQIPCAFVTIAVDELQPNRFSHVYVKCQLPDTGEVMIMDCSHGSYPGWETDREIYRRAEWLVN